MMPPHMGGALPPWPPPENREQSQPRAVVEFVANWIENQDLSCVDTAEELAYNWRGDMQRQPVPRALVAISPDRQWLVVLSREIRQIGYTTPFAVLRCHGGDYMIYSHVKDTGQDAHAVLASWLEGRG